MLTARRLGLGCCVLMAVLIACCWVRGHRSADAVILFAPGGNIQVVATGGGRICLFLSGMDFGVERAWTAAYANGLPGEFQRVMNSIGRPNARSVIAGRFALTWQFTDALGVPRAWFIAAGIPHWLAIAACLLPPAWVVRRQLRRWRWKRGGCCLNCGYDLRATPGRCSECGAGQSGPTGD